MMARIRGVLERSELDVTDMWFLSEFLRTFLSTTDSMKTAILLREYSYCK
jgi:hypothetical protein